MYHNLCFHVFRCPSSCKICATFRFKALAIACTSPRTRTSACAPLPLNRLTASLDVGMTGSASRRKRVRPIVIDSSSGSDTEAPVEVKNEKKGSKKLSSCDDIIDVDAFSTPIIDANAQPVAKSKRRVRVRVHDHRTAPNSVSMPLGERARSLEVGMLAMSAKKRRELGDWLDAAWANRAPRTLLLCGPPGCGKWVALCALLSERGHVTVQWEAPSRGTGVGGGIMRRLVESLRTFLTCAQYNALPGISDSSGSRVVVLRDLPVSMADAPVWRSEMQEIIASYVKAAKTPSVLVLSDDAKGVARAMRLLGHEVVHSAYVGVLRVPAPTEIATKRTLTRVAQAEQITVSQKAIATLARSSRGDIRAALNALHLSCARPNVGAKRVAKRARHSEVQPWVSKDGSVGTYHAVSKVLNNKRDENGCSKYDAEQVLEDAQAEPSAFLAFLHQNYADFFGCSIDASRALDTLCEADVLMAWHSDHLQRSCLTDCAASVATRAFLYHNQHAKRTGWRPIRGPESFEVHAEKAKFVDRARGFLPTQLFGRASVLDNVAYAEKIRGVRVAAWNDAVAGGGDADIAMVDMEDHDRSAQQQLSDISGRSEPLVLTQEIAVEAPKEQVVDDEIEEWESDAA